MITIDPQPSFLIGVSWAVWFCLPYTVFKICIDIWRENENPKWLLLLPPMILQTILALVYNNDTALIMAYNLDQGATLPYGRLWFFLNPFYGQAIYLQFILGWNFAFLGIMYFLITRNRLKVEWVYWCEVLNVMLMFVHNPQSIVPMTFVYLVPALTPVMLAIAAIIKLPIGWSIPISANRHWQCAFGSQSPVGAPFWECLHFTPSYFLVSSDAWFNFTVYIVVGIWGIRAVNEWRAGRTPRKLAFDFLNQSHLAPWVIWFMQKTGLYERRVTRLVKSLSGHTAVDVGANDGYYMRLLQEHFLNVLAIDPNPKYKHYPLMALSDYNGTASFYVDKNSARAGSLFPEFRYRNALYSGKEKFTVQVRRLDNHKGPIDFVKIDVEGAEFEVIKGMSGANVSTVLVELHDEARDLELIALLGLQKFTVTRIDRNHFLGEKHF